MILVNGVAVALLVVGTHVHTAFAIACLPIQNNSSWNVILKKKPDKENSICPAYAGTCVSKRLQRSEMLDLGCIEAIGL